MKKIIVCFVCILMLVTSLSLPVFAATTVASGNCGANGSNVTWVLDDAGTLTISGTGPMEDYTFNPDVPWYNKRTWIKNVIISSGVTSIGGHAFGDCTSLTRITIPDSVTSIGEYAFSSCSSLTSITIPNSVTNIGWAAFISCSSLTSITIPDSVTSIDMFAFASCDGLINITIPGSVTSIEEGTFHSCSSLTSITIPGNVTSIGSSAFEDCTGLTSITIPDSVTSIVGAFYGCSSLTNISVSEGNPNYIDIDGVLLNKEKTKIICYPEGKSGDYIIPDSVTSIGGSAFLLCFYLTSITIPDSVTSIGSSAFSGCTSLTSVTIPDSVTSIGSYAFKNCSSIQRVEYGGSAEEWAEIYIDTGNEYLTGATVHYNSLRANQINVSKSQTITGWAFTATTSQVQTGNSIYVAIYSENNELLNMQMMPADASGKTMVEVPKNAGAAKAKIFLWSGGILPKAGCKELPLS